MAKPLLADLFCALLKTPQRDQTLGAYVEKQMLSLRRLSAGQLRDALFEAVQLACRHSPRPDQDESDQLRGMVLAYIEENYADPDLCVQRICQHVGRARSSVFALFGGQNAGDSLLGAISRTRVEAAKTLLETSALGVHEIGIQVGYLNVNTFLRVFKKYEGVTPGQYRQMTANRQPEKAQPPLTQ
jgi:YesN/AraC family two-component response regulator